MAYTITGEKCGTVRLDAEKTGVVVTESVQRSSKVTSNPVEKGSDINDHVINDPVVFSITGVFLDEDQSDILERMWKEKDVVEYTGRTRISDCVITSFKSDMQKTPMRAKSLIPISCWKMNLNGSARQVRLWASWLPLI